MRVTTPDPKHQAQFGPRDDQQTRQREAMQRAEDRLKAAGRLMSQVGELIGQVRGAVEKNEDEPDAPRANSRLFHSAAETVRDLVENTRSHGETIFESVQMPRRIRERHALAAYSANAGHYIQIKEEGEPASARIAIRKTEHRLKGREGIIAAFDGLASQIIYKPSDAEPALSAADESVRRSKEELASVFVETDLSA